ncbi:MAG: hypothetical protein A3B04_01855 [Candidatus Portnoybacteria bacterium RIFCSPLOWO2_02_FULL_39_11]|uniref:Cohesin domain-containing protein n=1 Tax=Candidatus Portnoybacteria bacterium RIFCSPLOWO2_02_FULL_39_11 TaxID=1802001 RepID=A0A1G2FVZ6_9BACT|nr:MAG: hypothetical protein A3B04_01855 [Candidatus Portnoybacteria bacterium RIFCSPLOWO2_02_FULL_39_11]
MKKIIPLLAIGGALFFSAAPAIAATTVAFTPTSVSVQDGQSFNITIYVDPQGVKNYTVKMSINFPADLLEARSFNFGSGWMALSQPGYDTMDNVAGSLIKTAGYPGGLSSSAVFGVVSFSAKKTGSGVIKTIAASQALDANNQNVLADVAQTSVSISASAVATPTPTRTATPSPSGQPQTTSPAPSESAIPQESTTPPVATEQTAPQPESFLLAAIGNFFSLGTSSALVVIVFILLIMALIYIVWDHFTRHKKQQ